jgi:hypothetical protein
MNTIVTLTPVLITKKKCTSAHHCTAGCAVSIFILITINCTANAQHPFISYDINKINVLFYPYIHTRDGYRLFWVTFRKNNVELYYIVSLLTT